MLAIDKRLKRLAKVAHLYYEENLTQSEVAKHIGVSRPTVSKLLTEARELGIVTIKINELTDVKGMLVKRIKDRFNLKDVRIVYTDKTPFKTNNAIVTQSFEVFEELQRDGQVGLGWGSMIGIFIDYVEKKHDAKQLKGDVCPLIGGIKASYRSYHTNELVRILAAKTGLQEGYLYFPAMVDSEAEREAYEQTEAYKEIYARWDNISTAIINISNYPSTPDIATSSLFGEGLLKERAVGSFLAHYYDYEGKFIEPIYHNVLQIEVEQLKKAKQVIVPCNCQVKVESLFGALKTGIITHLIISDELAIQVLSL